MSAASFQVVPLVAAPSTRLSEAQHQDDSLTITDPVSLATRSDQDLAHFTSVSVLIPAAASFDALKDLSTIELNRITSMVKLTFMLRFGIPSYEETRRGWACIVGILAGLKGVSPKTPIAVFVEDAVPLAVLRASFGQDAGELDGLRRFLFGADKKLVTLIDDRTLGSVSLVLPPPATRYMLEEDEVRLKSLFPALRDYGMLLYP